MKVIVSCAAVTGLMLAAPMSLAGDWVHGINLGLAGLNLDGDLGFDSAFGPVELEVDLDPGDVNDATSSVMGLAGFSRKDDLTISYGFGILELEGDTSATQGANKLRADADYTQSDARIMTNFTFAKAGDNSFGVIAGVRYSERELDLNLKLNGERFFKGKVDGDWTDVVVGLGHSYAFSPTLSWNTSIDYGFGGSDGTTHANTGISKIFSGHWIVGLSVDYKDVQYEDGTRGTGNYFNYDVEETRVILGLGYVF